ncbi:hypothetical protein [Succinivibrio dextrinosolvens]|uniref:hypothetical protein n=1 Tax=Succinivibrio dextrinosolvens TaxID=83771 RepID=UPI00241FE928|nr:hypothetical protein [Succinivibrio dextrinosolvens]MBE6424212.1 hypothetical protein [Succinivibrio dextrinosolvens]
MFKSLSYFAMIMALGAIFCLGATIDYIHTVYEAVKEKTGFNDAKQKIENKIENEVDAAVSNAVDEGREALNKILKK